MPGSRSRTSTATPLRRRGAPIRGHSRPSGPLYRLPRRSNHRRNTNLTDFLTDYGVVVALVCAAAAVLYGLLVTQRLLSKSAGNDRMREISGAVQEGAQAYLSRQYTIIAALAVPIAILLLALQN